MLALGANGTPSVAYVRGTKVVLSTRAGKDRWRATNIGSASAGSQVKAFTVGSRGPVALVQSADGRRIFLVRRVPVGWQTIRIAGSLPAGVRLGWPGLALDKKGLPVVAYTRWNSANFNSRLLLVRVDARGKLTSKRITYEGFPQSYVPPPAKPVVVGGRIDVIESYGYHGVVGTIEWYPNKRTWTGLFLDAGVGDFPLGPVLALHSRTGRVYAAWTESMLGIGEAPVTLAERGRLATSEFVLDRALATGLALPASGPEVAANEWVDADELDLGGDAQLWAGTVVRGKEGIELDGWVAGFAAPRARRARPAPGRPRRSPLVQGASRAVDARQPRRERRRGRERPADGDRGRRLGRARDDLPRAAGIGPPGDRQAGSLRRRVLVRGQPDGSSDALSRGLHGSRDGDPVRVASTRARYLAAAGADGLAEGPPLVAEPTARARRREDGRTDEERPHQRHPQGEVREDHRRRVHRRRIGCDRRWV